MNIPTGIINPFSENFSEIWGLYKMYRLELDGFVYKGVISEQMALKKLVEVSGGDEIRATRIVEQTIASGKWTGFFPLKTTTYKEDGKSKQSTSEVKPTESERLRKEAADELMRRNGGGENRGSSDYLKAV